MSRRNTHQTEAPGQDSFLDVVANLVGVMIILVMVVGTQARNAMSIAPEASSADSQGPTTEKISSNTQLVTQELAAEELAARDLANKLREQEMEIEFRRGERDQALVLCTAAEQILATAKNKLTDEDRREVELKTAISHSQQELEHLTQALTSVSLNNTAVEVLKHYPTPIAKTVFGQELHFRIQGGRIAYVPFEEGVEMLKNDAPKRLWKLKETDRVVENMGPIQGFTMRYALKREQVSVSTGGGVARQERAVLDQFVLLPVQDKLGEEIEVALTTNSEFNSYLALRDPKRCVITLWVYTDSFELFRQVREYLLKRGYTCAARPMPEGHPIGGSPEGSRSAAQ